MKLRYLPELRDRRGRQARQASRCRLRPTAAWLCPRTWALWQLNAEDQSYFSKANAVADSDQPRRRRVPGVTPRITRVFSSYDGHWKPKNVQAIFDESRRDGGPGRGTSRAYLDGACGSDLGPRPQSRPCCTTLARVQAASSGGRLSRSGPPQSWTPSPRATACRPPPVPKGRAPALVPTCSASGSAWGAWERLLQPSRTSRFGAESPSRSIKPGLDSAQVIRQLKSGEQATVAMMDHPNIARGARRGAPPTLQVGHLPPMQQTCCTRRDHNDCNDAQLTHAGKRLDWLYRLPRRSSTPIRGDYSLRHQAVQRLVALYDEANAF